MKRVIIATSKFIGEGYDYPILEMILMYLTRYNEKDRFVNTTDMAWKGYDFETINELDSDGFIGQGGHRSKYVVIAEKGLELSRELLNKYHISDWN